MKKLVRIIFKLYRLVFKVPMRSEIRLALEINDFLGIKWYVGMLYVCGESVEQMSSDLRISVDEVKQLLIEIGDSNEFK